MGARNGSRGTSHGYTRNDAQKALDTLIGAYNAHERALNAMDGRSASGFGTSFSQDAYVKIRGAMFEAEKKYEKIQNSPIGKKLKMGTIYDVQWKRYRKL